MSWMSRLFRRSARTDCEIPVRFVPSSEKLPGLWSDSTNNLFETRPDSSLLPGASTEALEELCDDFWNSFSPGFEEDTMEATVVTDPNVHNAAIEELASRGLQALPWARSRLRHSCHLAREGAAWLVGELCSKHPLDDEVDAVIGELSDLATRPIEEDTKEVQANALALVALSKIGGPKIVPTLRRILTSPEWEQDDLIWQSALILGIVLDLPFGESQDPPASAREWLTSNPDA
ncbi:HEAT repeat domain-containing protein [Planctomyces sp. SH-PL62]|uniref:HEAT repeat domain-containing protein n=1 Tax=Planctomyces sp. SH-PL62 TaxID=1636152 RepID=UPI00078E22A5|nr:hypothetical protein [Planctomyces sp. SH-PL62]AMV37759.1 hypothetical protein VT85_10005 [Planctomyces sp. SH-PL62]